MKEEKIKSCPFCGHSDASVEFDRHWGSYSVMCGCGAQGAGVGIRLENCKEEAIKLWNKRKSR